MIEQFKVLSSMNGKPSVKVSELSDRFGEPVNRMTEQMVMLKLKGYIAEVEASPSDPSYKLTDKGQAMVGEPVHPTFGD